MTTIPSDNKTPTAGSWLTFRAALTVLAWMISLAVAALFAFSLLGHYFLLAELVSSFRAQVSVLLVASAAFLLLMRQRRWGLILLAVSVWQLLSLASIFLPATQPEPGPDRIKLMSINVWGDNKQFDEMIAQIQEESPDVLLVIEYSNSWHHQLKALHSAYPHRLLQPRWHGYGIALFSKRPLESPEVWQLTSDQTDVPAVVACVKIGDRRIRVAGLHTMSPTSSLRLNLRNDQMKELATQLATTDKPTILMGDFNCTPWSPYFHDVIERCNYADSRQGQGHQASWNQELPALFWIPIDHALVSDEVHVHRRYTGEACGSDHRPIIMEVSVGR